MEKEVLTIEALIREAGHFCRYMSTINHTTLIGVTDGKAIGTYIERGFRTYLAEKYTFEAGNSARGIDLPGESIMTDIKVTSVDRPQSSCPFQDARQKIYGLGYNILVLIYKKQDFVDKCTLEFRNCTFISASKTGDYTLTKHLIEMMNNGASKEDIIEYFNHMSLPGDSYSYSRLADEVLRSPPSQGYLTISNALQWRLQYGRAAALNNSITGIYNVDC